MYRNPYHQDCFQPFLSTENFSPRISPLLACRDFSEYHSEADFDLENSIPFGNLNSHNQELSSHQEPLPKIEVDQEPEADTDRFEIRQEENTLNQYVHEQSSSRIEDMIHFLLKYHSLPIAELKSRGSWLYRRNPSLENVFDILTQKFKSLKKTKEEMTKFCMRKAFKYASDQQAISKKRKTTHTKGSTEIFDFQMPFKKNSTAKTMNNQFLSKVFANGAFLSHYHNFLECFKSIIYDDNQAKIKYLAESINAEIACGKFQKIQNTKRLPWTVQILEKTESLAHNLLRFSEEGGPPSPDSN